MAAAGSGKTRLLLDVLNTQISKGAIDPHREEIVVFTFTNKAGEELAYRFSKMLPQDSDLLGLVFIGTIHGWCNAYLDRHVKLANTKVVDELEQYQLILRVYPSLGLDEAYGKISRFANIETFTKDLEVFYNEGLTFSEVPSHVKPCISKYLEILHQYRLLDFGSLVRESTAYIKSEKEGIVRHLFVDEYQDVNPAQVELFKTMLDRSPHSSMFAVGDPRQSIYHWRGSDVNRILDFKADFGAADVFTMKTNFRSRPGIIGLANRVAGSMDISSLYRLEDTIGSPDRFEKSASVVHDQSCCRQEDRIVRFIEDLNAMGVDHSDMAILMRSVLRDGPTLMTLLTESGIPFYSPNVNRGTDFIRDFMGSVFTLIDLISGRVVPANRQEQEEAEESLRLSLRTLKTFSTLTSDAGLLAAIGRWHEKLTKPLYEPGPHRHAEYANESFNFRQQLYDFCSNIGFTVNKLDYELQDGFSAITQVMRAVEEAYRRRLADAPHRAPPIEVFMNNLRWQLEHEVARWAEVGMDMASRKGVAVSTIHAAKGLEWSVVIAPFLWKGKFPVRASKHGTSFPDRIAARYGTREEDERRLWYVTITRARDRFYMLSGSDARQEKPSPFLDSTKGEDIVVSTESNSVRSLSHLATINPAKHEGYQRIGVSDLLLLMECPYHFYLRKMKNVDVPVSERFGAGNIVHRVIERMTQGSSVSLKSIVEEEVYLPLAECSTEKRVKKSIETRLERVEKSALLNGIELTETPIRLHLANILVTGVVDAVRRVGKTYEVIDWKFSIHDRFRIRYQNQIKVYAAGLNAKGYRVDRGIIYDLSSKNMDDAAIVVDVSDKELASFESQCTNDIIRLQRGEIVARPSIVVCRACDVEPICPDSYMDESHSSEITKEEESSGE